MYNYDMLLTYMHVMALYTVPAVIFSVVREGERSWSSSNERSMDDNTECHDLWCSV